MRVFGRWQAGEQYEIYTNIQTRDTTEVFVSFV